VRGPWSRCWLFPRHLAKTDPDVCNTLGLRGTGGDTFTLTDLFVGGAHPVTRE
jgi:hypothetical protein